MSQQGLFGLTNPFVTCESTFEGYIWVGSDSVFRDCLWVQRGCVGWQIRSSPVEAVSGAIYEWAAIQFSLTVYESTGAVWADESIRHLWKHFRGLYLSGKRLSFPWLFMSPKGLYWLTNPFVTCGSSFGGYLWVGSDSVFLVCLWVNSAVGADEPIHHLWKEFRGLLLSGQRLCFPWLFMSLQGLWGMTNPFITCERSFEGHFWVGSDLVFRDCLWVKMGYVGCRIHSSPVKAFFRAIIEWAATQFSLSTYESTWPVWDDESVRHLWNQFRGRFLIGQRLSFSWLFIRRKGLCGLTNSFVTYERSFGGSFWCGSDSVFLVCLWGNMGYLGWRIRSSPAKAVSGATFDWAVTQFSLTLSESVWAICADEFTRYLYKQFGWLYWLGIDSVFRHCLWVKWGCVGWRIHSSPLKGVSRATSKWAATQFSLTIYESVGAMYADESLRYLFKQFGGLYWLAAIQFSLTVYESVGAVWADESIHHLGKQFPGLFLSGKRLRFPWLFISQQGLWGLTNPIVTCESSFRDIFEGVANQFSLTVSESVGAMYADESLCYLFKQFGGLYWLAAIQFSVTVYESIGAVWAGESIRYLRKAFRGLLLSGQRLSFLWLFMSPKGLCWLTNSFVTCGSSFGGYLWVGSNSVFLVCLWVNRAVGADESIRQLWKEFRGLFLSGQRLSFP